MVMGMRLELSDDTYAQVTALAEAAGQSVGEWVRAAVEREAYRQLCEQQARWNAEHPEQVRAAADDWRARGSSAA
ncbi:hypothetical protein AMETH_1036 [Amycolatopsis methanolica 239]|uniref:Ribbon-helix-helix protein CopG domain-containing protein n=4 Tax=Pseudonocardiaceae TaxID=2070 RepID=A0A076MJY0_AMYME|nr:hypothetical protein AMETH_1036 [Amycolatopsis methanolica 239]ROS40026.1 ribbon-helix-helix CopG family protein [Amycolatopsis thermoflava]